MASIIDLEVQQSYFDAIKAGSKIIEGRLAKQKYLDLKVGDAIRFTTPSSAVSVTKTVAKVYYYPTFEAAFKEQDFTHAIPGAHTAEDAVKVYEQFYSRQLQEEVGVVFIELQ